MNVELLERVKQHILEEPRRLNMGHWLLRDLKPSERIPACGTVACIAGWAVLLGDGDTTADVSDEAANLLGIEPEPGPFDVPTEADRLFYVHGWPPKFREEYAYCDGSSERANITARRIDRFIQTNGKE